MLLLRIARESQCSYVEIFHLDYLIMGFVQFLPSHCTHRTMCPLLSFSHLHLLVLPHLGRNVGQGRHWARRSLAGAVTVAVQAGRRAVRGHIVEGGGGENWTAV